ncbi:hypothetical protein JB92DRAFT_3093082 [Gautieria morchelliformis]|nr:hypothetical protein JB92DRAFT_3093082 [Gautieria morchelliformis]
MKQKCRALQEIDLRQLPTPSAAPRKPNMGKAAAPLTNNAPKTSTRATAITEHADSSRTKGMTHGMTEKGREWSKCLCTDLSLELQMVKIQQARERRAKEAEAKEAAQVKSQTQSTYRARESQLPSIAVYTPHHLFHLRLANLAEAAWGCSELTNYETVPMMDMISGNRTRQAGHDELDVMKETQNINLLPVYDLDHSIIAPKDYKRCLLGAIVEVQVALIHYLIGKKYIGSRCAGDDSAPATLGMSTTKRFLIAGPSSTTHKKQK